MRWIILLFVVTVAALLTIFRFARHDAELVNTSRSAQDVGDVETGNSFHVIRQFTTSETEILKAVDLAILQSPRTTLLVRDMQEGVTTYVTRSLVFGFPDYTTVWIDTTADNVGPHLNIRGRARFGVSDLGVNKARIEGWLDQLGPLIVAP